MRRKRTRPISSHLNRASLVNRGFIIWLLGKFFLQDTVGGLEWQVSSILPARVANHSAGFDSSWPLAELAM